MTLVACWVNMEQSSGPSIWTISDSKVLNVDDGSTVTEHAAKLLELPIICRTLSEPFPSPYFRSSIGFAYAGNTLLATNVHATLSVVLSNLGSSKKYIPHYQEILEKATILMQEYTKLDGRLAEVCLYGTCPQTKLPFIALISPVKPYEEWTYKTSLLPINHDQLTCVMIGDRTAQIEMKGLIVEKLKEDGLRKSSTYWRTPIFILRDMLLRGGNDAIGGELQMTICNEFYFHHFWVEPLKSDETYVRTLRGIDLDKLGLRLGECHLSIYGMDYMFGTDERK